MRKRALTLCLTLLAVAVSWSPSLVGAQEAPACPKDVLAGVEMEATSPFLSSENAPSKRVGCYISCNTDFNISCSGSTFPESCYDSVDIYGTYFISCDNVRYDCPPCPSWNPWHCVD